MRSLSLLFAATLAVGWLVTATQVGFAEPKHKHPHKGVPKYRVGFQLFSPLGVRVTEQQEQYQYVVPSAGRYGTFYSHDDAYYYTPPVNRVVGQPPQPAPRPVTLKFGGFQYHVELANRLETLANQFCLDLHFNYQNNHEFDETYGEAYQLLQAAKFIVDKDNAGDHAGIQRSVSSIDELFHHVQEDVRGWRSANRRQIGHLNLAAKTEELEAVLHHLMFDIGVKPAHDEEPEEAAPQPREDAPPPRRR